MEVPGLGALPMGTDGDEAVPRGSAQSLVETQEEQQTQLHSGMFSRHTQGAQGQEKGFSRAM